MQVKLKRALFGPNQTLWAAGSTQDLSDTQADELVGRGDAEYVGARASRDIAGDVVRIKAGQFTSTEAQEAVRNAVGGAGARADVLNGASAGTSSAWLPIAAYPERLAYELDSGSTATTFSVDISADGSTSLGQAFTGTWASTTAHITQPLMFSNPQARFFRFNVLSGGPLSVSRGY